MAQYTLNVLGLDITFRTDADADRVHAAKNLVEEQFSQFNQDGKNISKEMLLTVLALSLADDYLQAKSELREIENKLGSLLKIQ
ncbi:cell division protein ZapA [Desulfohalovibrio reitneri]|jgi:cell division protein ZapA|uniref:cell division protein ZapA n=1 Tax=Desulfohalovibrio reitneri TaxID=1307759 RepID=UPI0004A6E82F|nr:cell division protein ZapA [Desulfohalovibrio reitneri]